MSKLVPQTTVLIALAVALGVSTRAEATNTPCSGHKGGIDHCQGSTFIFNDGSVSASRKSCQAYMGGAALLGSTPPEMEPAGSSDCLCRGGSYCVGPRGGHYCLTDDGRKSYLRRRFLPDGGRHHARRNERIPARPPQQSAIPD